MRDLATRIVPRPIGSPLPLGVLTVAAAPGWSPAAVRSFAQALAA